MCALTQVKVEGIMRAAQPFIYPKSTEVVEIMEASDDDDRACLVFDSSDDRIFFRLH